MKYQGHMPDGSSVQKHSAGPAYPFVVYGQETPEGLRFGVIGPGHTTSPILSCEDACLVAESAACVRALRLQRQAQPQAQPVYPDGWGVV